MILDLVNVLLGFPADKIMTFLWKKILRRKIRLFGGCQIMSWTILILSLFVVRPSHGSEGIMPPCHTVSQKEEGVITSPNFPNNYSPNLHCIYDISRLNDENCGVRLTFENFHLEDPDSDGFCKNDYLGVDSCVPEGGSRFCGNISVTSYDYPFNADAEVFRLIFKSNNGSETKGFRIAYKLLTDCRHGLYWDPPITLIPGVYPHDTPCYTQVTERKGTINTPYFPRNYPNSMDCVNEFVRGSSFVCGIRMRVLTFELDAAIDTQLGGACLDFFHAPGCGFLCGSLRFLWTAKYQPGASSLKFHFHSDEKKTRPGFQIAFEQIYDCS